MSLNNLSVQPSSGRTRRKRSQSLCLWKEDLQAQTFSSLNFRFTNLYLIPTSSSYSWRVCVCVCVWGSTKWFFYSFHIALPPTLNSTVCWEHSTWGAFSSSSSSSFLSQSSSTTTLKHICWIETRVMFTQKNTEVRDENCFC